jgi:hypothetical protein
MFVSTFAFGQNSTFTNLTVRNQFKTKGFTHDSLGSLIGASPSAITFGFLTDYPQTDYKFNNKLYFSNTVNNGLFDVTGLDNNALCFGNTVTGLSNITVTGSVDSFIGNATLNNFSFYSTGNIEIADTGNFSLNNFLGTQIDVVNNSGTIEFNTFTAGSSFTSYNNNGRIFGNNGAATITANNMGYLAKFAGNTFIDNPIIDVSGTTKTEAGFDANFLIGGGSSYLSRGLNGKFFSNFGRSGGYTVITDSLDGWISDCEFAGGDYNTAPYAYPANVNYTLVLDSGYKIQGCSFDAGWDITLAPNFNYTRVHFGNKTFADTLVIGNVGGYTGHTPLFKYDIASAATGSVLTSVNADGNATWSDPTGFGEMGFGDSTRTLALTQNVFSVVTNSNNTLWQTAAIDLHNVTYSGDSLIIDSAGTYQVNIQLSMDGTSGSIIRLGVFLNGALACSCTGYQELLNNRILQLSYIDIDALNAGDVLQVVIMNTANNDDVDLISGKITINKL